MRIRRNSPLATRSRRRTNILPQIDALEDRRLMAVAFVETALPAPAGSDINPYLVTHASDGSVWTIEAQYNASSTTYQANRTDSQGNTTAVPGLPAGEPAVSLFAGASGSVWAVTDAADGSGHVVKLTANYNVVGSLPNSPKSATLGADGDIWVTAHNTDGTDSIEKFDPRTGTVTQFAPPRASMPLGTIVAATDGNLWATEPASNQVAKINTTGQITEYPLGFSPRTIAAGAGGSVWVAGIGSTAQPVIAQVTSNGTSTIDATLSPTTQSIDPSTTAISLAAAPDGTLWFINEDSSSIGHLKSDNSLDNFPLPQIGSDALSLTTDGGAGFYFTQRYGPSFVHLQTDAPDPTVLLTANSIQHVEGPLPSGITIATFTTTDAAAFSFDFTARYQIGNQAPQVGTVLSDGNGGFVVQTSGSDPIQQPGAELMSVTVLDGQHNDSIGVKSSGISVLTVQDAPVAVSGQSFTVAPGVAYTGAIATLTDPDGNAQNDAQTQTTINWGDGYTSAVTTAGSVAGSALTVPGGHVYASPGNYTVTITANHGGTISTGTATATVSIPAITSISPVTAGYSQGHSGEALVATFQTSSPSVASNYHVSSDAPSGGAPSRIVEVNPTLFQIWTTADFSTWGEQSFAVYVGAGDPWWVYSTSVEADAIVTPAPITATALPITISPQTSTYGQSQGNVASFKSGNPQAQAWDYQAIITSGDGGSWTASIVGDGNGGFLVVGGHDFAISPAGGTTSVTIKINNLSWNGAVSNGATLTENVTVPPRPALFSYASGTETHANVNTNWTGTVANFGTTDPQSTPSDFTVTLHWSDGAPDSLGQVVQDAPGVFHVTANRVFTAQQGYSATLTIAASDGEHVTGYTGILVSGSPVVLTGEALTGTQGTPISAVVATFRDPTPNMPSAYAATIDWGDGTTSTGTVSTYQGEFVIFGSHVYATAGPHAYGVIMQETGFGPITTSGTVMVTAPKPVGPIGTPAGGGPVGGTPLTIVSARTVRGKHGSVRVVVTLSGTVNSTTVASPSEYVLTESVKAAKHKTKTIAIKITSATYDPSSETVTLVPKGSFSRPAGFKLALAGSSSVTAVAS